MPIDRIKANTLKLVVDDVKTIVVKADSKRNAELNKDLLDPAKFKEFALRYDIAIDQEISDQLHIKMRGLDSMERVKDFINPIDPVGATLWAVASGSYSIASSKIAVAW